MGENKATAFSTASFEIVDSLQELPAERRGEGAMAALSSESTADHMHCTTRTF